MTQNIIGEEVRYDDIETIRAALVGKRIVAQTTVASSGLAGYGHGSDAVEFTLDDGTKLYAIDADGGCACTNGCFWVSATDKLPENVITNVEQVEEANAEEYDTAIRLFVYQGGIRTELFYSHGDDNGYYGWGHHIVIQRPAPTETEKP